MVTHIMKHPVYAYIQCLDGPVNWFSLTFCVLKSAGVSNKICLLPLFHLNKLSWAGVPDATYQVSWKSVQ